MAILFTRQALMKAVEFFAVSNCETWVEHWHWFYLDSQFSLNLFSASFQRNHLVFHRKSWHSVGNRIDHLLHAASVAFKLTFQACTSASLLHLKFVEAPSIFTAELFIHRGVHETLAQTVENHFL
ncbi:MAG: hypothetical protein AAFW97_07380 [Pseudomonadota bacterium]